MAAYVRPPTDFAAIARRGRAILEAQDLADKYMQTVAKEAKDQGAGYDHVTYTTMYVGLKEMLMAVDKHTPIDFDMLKRYPPRELCHTLNEAMEHAATTGMFKEGWKPEWVS